jgi:hypothetical protein
VTNLDGSALNLDARKILASNGKLHCAMRETITRRGRRRIAAKPRAAPPPDAHFPLGAKSLAYAGRHLADRRQGMNANSARCQYQSPRGIAHCRLRAVPDFRPVQGFRHAVHFGRSFQYLDRQFPQRGGLPVHGPVLRGFVLGHAKAIEFFVAYGELPIGLTLGFGVLVRVATGGGLIYMFTLLFAAKYPGHDPPLWQYFSASLEQRVLAMCLAAFALPIASRCLRCGRGYGSRWRSAKSAKYIPAAKPS